MSDKNSQKYIRTVGRRKTSVAIVKLIPSTKSAYTINYKDFKDYFPTEALRKMVTDPFVFSGIKQKFEMIITTRGGGVNSQAEAVRHGIARALVKYDEELHSLLKKEKMLKRDPRSKERRKFGLKKARKAPQWSKR